MWHSDVLQKPGASLLPSASVSLSVMFPHSCCCSKLRIHTISVTCCLTSSFLWTTQVGCIQVASSHTAPLRVRGLREARSAVHSLLCQGRWPHGPCGEGWYSFPVHLPLGVQPCGDAGPLSLGGPGLCPLPPAPQGTVNTEAGIHLVENVKLMRTSFVYTSGFPLSLSSLAS